MSEAKDKPPGSAIICSYREMETLAGLEGAHVVRLNEFDCGFYTHEVLYRGYRFMTSSDYRIAQRKPANRQT